MGTAVRRQRIDEATGLRIIEWVTYNGDCSD